MVDGRRSEQRSISLADDDSLAAEQLQTLASTAVLRACFRAARGTGLVLVGVGGVASGADAYAKVRAGASLVQLYTGFAYGGPALVGRIKRELAALLARDGIAHVADAVGLDA